MPIKHKHLNPTRQSGVVLFVSLILLSVLTLLAVTGMKTSIIEEKMSGNLRDNELAHQAAESALREAETFINNLTSVTALTNTNGLYRAAADAASLEPDYLDPDTWDPANTSNYTEASDLGGSAQLAQPPKYIIKHIGNHDLCEAVTGGISDPNSAFNTDLCIREIFRVTAHGTGVSPDTTKTLQAYFELNKL